MQEVSIKVPKEEIKKALLQLEPDEMRSLLRELKERKEVWDMMKLSESSLDFWFAEGEDIYSDEL